MSEDKEVTLEMSASEETVQGIGKKVSKSKQKKFDRKQRKIDKKQNKLDNKKSSATKITKHKQKKFDRKQRKIDRKQRKLNKKGVKWSILPADVLPEKKFNNFKEFISYMKNKFYIKNDRLRAFVKVACVVLAVVIVVGVVTSVSRANAQKKWLEETYARLDILNSKINSLVVALGGEPMNETDTEAIQRKLDQIIKLLEQKGSGSSNRAQIDSQLSELESDLVDVSVEVQDTGADPSGAASSSSSETVQQAPSKSSSSSKTSSTSKSTVPSTKDEIIKYCNTALNKIKTSKPGYNKHYVMTVKGDVSGLPSWLVSLAKTDETINVKKGQNSNDIYPAAGYTWSSKLTSADVKEATLKQSGSKYIIKLTIVDEDNPKKGNSHFGRCMSVLEQSDVLAKSSLIKKASMHYYNGYIYAEIDSKTGNVTKSIASATADVKLNVSILGDVEAKQIVSTETFTDFVW